MPPLGCQFISQQSYTRAAPASGWIEVGAACLSFDSNVGDGTHKESAAVRPVPVFFIGR